MHLRRAVVIVSLLVAACGTDGSADSAATAADTLTRDQRDSILSESSLPGAGAVGRARETSRAAAERAAQMDSIQP